MNQVNQKYNIEENLRRSDITIAIPVYERYDFFEAAVASALNQTVPCKIIVVDNCSSHTKFEDFTNKLESQNVKYYKNSNNLGMYGNLNKCLDYCETDWITILHDDDALSVYYIEYVSAMLKRYPSYSTFAVNCEKGENPDVILSSGREKGDFKSITKFKPFHFLFNNVSPFPGILFNIKRNNSLKFDASWYPISDLDFWYRLSIVKAIIISPVVLAFYRISGIQTSATANKEIIEEVYRYRKEVVKFSNYIFKYFSLFELYTLFRKYNANYQMVEKGLERFKYPEMNLYFKLFENRVVFKLSAFGYMAFRTVLKQTTGY